MKATSGEAGLRFRPCLRVPFANATDSDSNAVGTRFVLVFPSTAEPTAAHNSAQLICTYSREASLDLEIDGKMRYFLGGKIQVAVR